MAQGERAKASKQDRKQQLEAEKIALITKELSLDADQAKVFWPVYDAYQKEIDQVRKEQRANKKAAASGYADMSDKEANEAMMKDFAMKEKEIAIQRNYYENKFPEVIKPKQTVKLYSLEGRWKKMLLKKMRDQRAAGKPGGDRPPRPERPDPR